MADDCFTRWLASLEARHLADLTFPEVSRGLRALSSTYVERRGRLEQGAALAGAGKRAAFALFYGPLHYLLVRHIVHALPGATRGVTTLVDVGCGTGASGAAWAAACTPQARVIGIDVHPWALGEAAKTYRAFELDGRTGRSDADRFKLSIGGGRQAPKSGGAAWLASFTVNELADAARDRLRDHLLARARAGDRVLVVEPLARSAARWWAGWQAAFEQAGGRADEWRLREELPQVVAKLDRAAGLDHREITGRSLWVAMRP